jgi:SAM-dependent methyltransferase
MKKPLSSLVLNLKALASRLKLKELRDRILTRRHRKSLRQKTGPCSEEYVEYLNTQFLRSWLKRNAPLPNHAKILIDKLAELTDLSNCDVLCVGCRNTAEIEYFQSKNAKSVMGIDLFSESPAIQVMDMHSMSFPDASFDVIYSAHSLEHSYDVQEVAKEFIRVGSPNAIVAIEVPLHNLGTADRIDFGGLQDLHALFEPHIGQVLWCEEQEPHETRNLAGVTVARTIFRLSQCTCSATEYTSES